MRPPIPVSGKRKLANNQAPVLPQPILANSIEQHMLLPPQHIEALPHVSQLQALSPLPSVTSLGMAPSPPDPTDTTDQDDQAIFVFYALFS